MGDMMNISKNQEKMKIKIAESFMEIGKTKQLSKISVTNIMASLSMSRQKFYYYFEDIKDLITWVNAYNLSKPFNEFCDDKDLYNSYVKSLTYIQENKQFYRNMLSLEGYGPLEDAFYNNMLEAAIKHIGAKRLNDELKFSLRLYLKGVTALTAEWLRNKANTSPEVLSDYFCKALPRNLNEFYNV